MPAAFDLVTFDSLDPQALAAFWSAALGLMEVQREDGGRWIVLADGSGARRIGIQRGVARPGGVHLDLSCTPDEFGAEVARLVGVGATLVSPVRLEPYGSIANFADLDGNPFDLCAYGEATPVPYVRHSMNDEAAAHQSEISELLAIEAIKRLKATYFRTLDRKDWEAFAQVFASDAVLTVPEANMEVAGRQAIADSVAAAVAGTRTVHHGHMPEIEIHGTDRATGIWAMFDSVEWPETETGRVGLQGYGHYEEEYCVEDGRWRIARSTLVRLRIDWLGARP